MRLVRTGSVRRPISWDVSASHDRTTFILAPLALTADCGSVNPSAVRAGQHFSQSAYILAEMLTSLQRSPTSFRDTNSGGVRRAVPHASSYSEAGERRA